MSGAIMNLRSSSSSSKGARRGLSSSHERRKIAARAAGGGSSSTSKSSKSSRSPSPAHRRSASRQRPDVPVSGPGGGKTGRRQGSRSRSRVLVARRRSSSRRRWRRRSRSRSRDRVRRSGKGSPPSSERLWKRLFSLRPQAERQRIRDRNSRDLALSLKRLQMKVKEGLRGESVHCALRVLEGYNELPQNLLLQLLEIAASKPGAEQFAQVLTLCAAAGFRVDIQGNDCNVEDRCPVRSPKPFAETVLYTRLCCHRHFVDTNMQARVQHNSTTSHQSRTQGLG